MDTKEELQIYIGPHHNNQVPYYILSSQNKTAENRINRKIHNLRNINLKQLTFAYNIQSI